MPIGRITGPMLVPNLERQGIDLAVEGNLIYWDVTRRLIGVRTSTPEYVLDIRGNVFAGNTLTVGSNNIPLYRLPTNAAVNTGSILVSGTISSLPHETFWSNVLIIDQEKRLVGVDTNPKYKLDVAGNIFAGNGLIVGTNNVPIYKLPTIPAVTNGSILSFGTVGNLDTFWSNLLVLDEVHRMVGVDTNPKYKFDVAGNIFAGNGLIIGRDNQPLYKLPDRASANTGSMLVAGNVGSLDTFWSNVLVIDQIRRVVGIDKDPEYKLDIAGNLNVDSFANIKGNLWVGERITVSNQYVLPSSIPKRGDIIVALGGENSQTVWYPGPPEPNFKRRRYCKVIDTLLGFGKVEFEMKLGQAAIVYNLTVSRPVKVEVFSTPDKNEPNPYTFIATPDHLTDDGSVWLNDGSSFQSRQYSIFTNLEEPPKDIHYVTITSIDNHLAATPVIFELLYYPPLLDSEYEYNKPVKFGSILPTANISTDGDLFYNISVSKLYLHYSGNWVAL